MDLNRVKVPQVSAKVDNGFQKVFGGKSVEQVKTLLGENPGEILTKHELIGGNTTETQEQTQNHQLLLLAEQLKQLIKKEVSE